MSGITNIAFAPELPLLLIAALAAVSVVVVAFALFRRAAGVGWRALALATALLALASPSLVEEEREPLTDVAVVVVDESPSQSVGQRLERSRAALADIETALKLHDDLEVRVVTLGSGLREGESVDTAALPADGTRLFAAIERALTDVPNSRIAGTILITDGQVHDTPKDPDGAALPGPIHVLLSGEKGEADRRIVVERVPAYGIVGQTLELAVKVDEPGIAGATSQARISVRRDGGRTDSYPVSVGEVQAIPFEVEHGGPNVLEIEVEPGPAELTLRNNRAIVVVNGVRDRLRVLLVSGEPHAGERVWRNLLKADPSVDLVHFTILRPPEKQDGTPINELSLIAFPIRELFEIKLEEFDLVIFDRYRRRGVLPHAYLDNIARYVEAGGALLEAAGPAFATPLSLYRTPLAQVLPGAPTGEVYVEGFRPALTSSGRRHPVTSDLPGADAKPPWGRWFRMVAADHKQGAVVLLSGVNSKPVLILDRAHEGRVAQLLSDQVWLWARGFEGGGPQAELLRRVAHWLMKEPDLEEEDLRASARGRRLEIVRRSLKPETAPVTVTSPSGRTVEVTLEPGAAGKDTGSMVISETGLYHLSDGRRTAVAAIGPINPKEFADPRTTATILRPTAEATGGGIFWLAQQGLPDIRRVRPERVAAGRGWLGLRANGDYIVTGVRQIPLLPPLVVLALLLGGLILAWRREGA